MLEKLTVFLDKFLLNRITRYCSKSSKCHPAGVAINVIIFYKNFILMPKVFRQNRVQIN